MTIPQKLDQAIARWTSEVARLQHAATVELPAAEATLAQLQQMQAHLTPAITNALTTLQMLGVL